MPRQLAQLDLNLLVVLDVLLTERSVTRAGKILGLSQPATSAALARLRLFFEDPLFVRAGRKVAPTSFALSLRQPLHEILRRIETTIEQRVEFDPSTSTREFTLALSDYSLLVLAPALHEAVTKRAPGVRLRFVPTEHLLSKKNTVVADIFIVPKTFARGRHEELFHDRWVFVADKKHPDIGGSLTVAVLRQLPLIRYAPAGTGFVADRALDSVQFERPAAITVSSFAAALLLLPRTRLVTLCQQRLISIARVSKSLRVLKPPFQIPPLLEVMAWNPAYESDAAHTWLRDMVRRVAAQL